MNGIDKKDIKEHEEAVDLLVKKFSKELNSGTSALVLLSILNNSDKPLYGYQISKLLGHSNTEKQGVIYPVLRNMEAKGLLESQVLPSESGPPRKYFTISILGKKVLEEWLQIWQRTQLFVNQIITGKSNGNDEVK